MEKKRRRQQRQEELALESQQRHQEIDRRLEEQQQRKRLFLIGGGILTVVFLLSLGFMSIYSLAAPGDFDAFAQCLTDSGVVVYGNMATCKYTQLQKKMFGNSFKYLDYREYYEYEGPGSISTTPTWFIDGEAYPKVQSFERLSTLTGCPIYGDTNEEGTEE